MECNAIKDLMQLYVDDLCSEESKTIVEEHLTDCDTCKKYFEELSNEQNKEKTIDEKIANKRAAETEEEIEIELKPFRKLRKKLWFRCILDVVAIIISLVAIVIVINAVSLGFYKVSVYYAEKNAKIVSNYLLNGESDKFVDSLRLEHLYVPRRNDEWREACIKSVDEFYNDYLAGKDVKVEVESNIIYLGELMGSVETCVFNVDGLQIYMTMETTPGNGVLLYDVYVESGDIDFEKYFGILHGANYSLKYDLIYEKIADCDNSEKIEKFFNIFVVDDESEKYISSLKEKVTRIYNLGVSIEKSSHLNIYFDNEIKKVCTVVNLEFKDQEGNTAIIQKKVVADTLMPASDDVLILDNGISDELKEMLENLF